MNYRHAFHAGNFADVFKHVVLLALLDTLAAKDKPLCYMDTHAGGGLYALGGEPASRTGEWREGIGRLSDVPDLSGPLRRYLDAVRACNPDGSLDVYPGSPLLAATVLRPDDRLALCECQDDEAASLRKLFRNDRRVHVHRRDGYAALNALLPPAERRGLVLVDPPFEDRDGEFDAIDAALRKAHARWPNGVYAVWYPIKSRRTLAPFHRGVAAGPFGNGLAAELLVHPDDSPLRLNGCGMVILNPPWRFEATLSAILPELARLLAQSPGGGHRVSWLRHADGEVDRRS